MWMILAEMNTHKVVAAMFMHIVVHPNYYTHCLSELE